MLRLFSRWAGWLSVDGQRIDVGAGWTGTRDRSWGIRPVGAAERELEEETGLNVDGLLYLQELKARDTVHHVFEASVVNIADARPLNEIVDCQWHAYGSLDDMDTTDATRHIVKSFLRRL